MNFTVITEPSVEPIDVDELKAQSRIDGTAEDSILGFYITAARQYFEDRTCRTIQETTLEAYPDSFGGGPIVLPRAYPLKAVTGVWYKTSDGTEVEWASSQYIVDLRGKPGSISPVYGGSYPSFTAYPASPIRIRYVAGLAVSPYVAPAESIKQAIRMLAAAMYENREGELVAQRAQLDTLALKYGVEAFIQLNQIEYRF